MSHSETPIWIQVGDDGPPKRILVSLDLGAGSRQTLGVAHQLAQQLEARLDLLHCFEGPAFAYSPSKDTPAVAPTYVVDSERRAEKEDFEKFVEQFEWKGVQHQTLFVEDDPAHRILELQERADLIVVGRHGHRGILGGLGSLANQLDRVVETPLLVIPHD
jgi:nucleotide-binding universal stress UspA family protein